MARKPKATPAPAPEPVADVPAPRATVPSIKWAAYQGTNDGGTPLSFQIGDNTGGGGQPLGTFAQGDLYIVLVSTAQDGGVNESTISGSGWTKIINAYGDDIRYEVWYKYATAA